MLLCTNCVCTFERRTMRSRGRGATGAKSWCVGFNDVEGQDYWVVRLRLARTQHATRRSTRRRLAPPFSNRAAPRSRVARRPRQRESDGYEPHGLAELAASWGWEVTIFDGVEDDE